MPTPMRGTSDLPQKYWKSARLTGKTPFFACQSDPRISYCLYVPASHYEAHPAGRKMRLVVNVHGSLRTAQACRDALMAMADRTGVAILAPLFPAGVEGPNDMHGYKLMCSGTGPQSMRYDKIMLAILNEVELRWPGIDVSKVFMSGFSGGGQFALRFLYLYPEKLEAVCVGAPGLVTRLDTVVTWPFGIMDVDKYFDGRRVTPEAIAAVPHINLIVGGDDTAEPNDGLYRILPQSEWQLNLPPQLKAEAGLPNRVVGLTDLYNEMKAAGIRSELNIVPGANHSTEQVGPSIFRWLEERVTEEQQRREL